MCLLEDKVDHLSDLIGRHLDCLLACLMDGWMRMRWGDEKIREENERRETEFWMKSDKEASREI